jgi:hypothetical protein
MGSHWWPLLPVRMMREFYNWCGIHQRRHPNANACPERQLEAGPISNHCEDIANHSGCASDRCRCQNDCRWDCESTAEWMTAERAI